MDHSFDKVKPSAGALVPFLVFAVFYVGLSLYAKYGCQAEMAFYKVPMPIAFLVASAVALAFNRKASLERKVDVFAAGMGEVNIMVMCLIFILAGAFAGVAKGSGAVEAAVTIAQALIPARLMVAGVFLVSCLISLAIGTSCGTIAAVAPIALGFAPPLHLSPALLLATVVGGSMFGDNLSMISDTTIAATRTQGVTLKEKFFANLRLAAPAALIALLLYAAIGSSTGTVPSPAVTYQHILLILPYLFILILALCGINVMLLLFAGAALASLLGLALGRLTLFAGEGAAAPELFELLGKGALGMSETLFVALLAGGLFRTVQANGGVRFLTERLATLMRGPRTCEFGAFLLVALVNCFTANNTVAIVIAGPLVKTCSAPFRAVPVRLASVLDTASCIVQGILPYGAQLLIALGIAHTANLQLSAFEIIPYLYYQPLLALAVLISIIFARNRK